MPILQQSAIDFLKRKAQERVSFGVGQTGMFQDTQSFLRRKAAEMTTEEPKPTFFQKAKGFFTGAFRETPKGEPIGLLSRETLGELTPKVVGEAGEKVITGIGRFGKTVGQQIAKSFLATGQFIKEFAVTPYEPEKYKKPIEFIKEVAEKTYTPIGKTEQAIFGTDKPISIKTIGEEVLMIGGEDFKNKWGKYSVPLGFVIAGLDITPIGWGKKDALKIASKAIAKTEDIIQIVKSLKPILKGTDEELGVLAKSLRFVNKEEDVLKVIQEAGKAKGAIPLAQKAIPEAIPAEKGIIPQELQPLASISRLGKANNDLMRVSEKAQELATYVDEKGITRIDGVKRVRLEKQLLKEANEELKLAQNEFYQSLNPKHKIGDVVDYQPKMRPEEIKVFGEKKYPIEKIKITGAEFDTTKSADQMRRTGFPASFKFTNLVGKNIKTGEEVRLYKSNLVNGKLLGDTIKVKPEEVLKEFIARQKALKIEEGLPQAVKGVKEVVKEVPKITPENTIQKLINAIDEAVPLRGEQKKLYSQEMAKRTARVAAMGEKVGGEKGFFAQLGQLKGELPKKQFEAIRNKFTQKEADLLFDTIEQAKTLLPLEKVSIKGGLGKLLEGAVPTKSELEGLREVFPKELIDAILARRPLLERMAELGVELTNVPRTMMATADLSAPLRQGIFMIGRPKRFLQSFGEMFKYAFSEKAYQGGMEAIKARPTYLKMRQAGLSLTEIGGELAKREEAFMGALAEKIPLWGRVVRASNRAYTGFLNKLRADVFDDILKQAKNIGRETDDSLLKSAAKFVNAGTGRGDIGQLQKIAPVLNAAFFSPRLMASRLNLLNPYFYIQLDPLVRKEALKTLFSTTAILGTIGGIWKLNGGEIGLDWRNADFGKMKIENTRYDTLGGFQQYIRLVGQLITGEIISSTTGRTITLGEGYKPLTRKDILLRFFEYKTSPIASFVIGLLTGTTAVGEDVDVPTEVINRFIPMVVQDIYDLSQEKGAEGILMGLPAIFGVGVQTYGKQELAIGESKLGEPTAQIRPVPELAEKIRELVLGQIKLGPSKGFSVEAYFDQLSDLPREEAADIFDKIAETNPELAKKLFDVVKERELGITVKDKDLKSKGVASGDRTLAIKKELDKLKTKEEKATLWDEYVKKGIITKKVSEQLLKLLNQ